MRAPQSRRIGGVRRRTFLILAALLVAVLGTTGVAVAAWNSNGSGDGGAALTRKEYPAGERPAAPPVAGETLDGGALDVAALRGQVVVVNVWASWCPPCRAETDDLEAVYQATQELGVEFVGINIRDDRDKAVSFLEGRVTYPSIFDPASAYALGFREPPAPLGPPATLVIDREGGVAAAIYRMIGPVELEEIVTRIAREP